MYNAVIDCGPLTVDGVEVVTDNTTFGSVAKFACKLGYELIGQSESICTDKGTWTDPFPTCTGTTHLVVITLRSSHSIVLLLLACSYRLWKPDCL